MAGRFGVGLRGGRLAAVLVGLSFFVNYSSRAELFVYEPFDYPAGEQLIGKNGGTGFTGPWRDENVAGAATIQAGSLVVPELPGFPTTGNSVLMTGSTGTSLQIFRNFTNIAGADGTTTWISFIGRRLGEASTDPMNPYGRGVNISFYSTEGLARHGREEFAIGNSSGAATNDWAFIPRGGGGNILPASDPPAPYGGAPPALVVVRIDHHGPENPAMDDADNNDDVYLFINPDIGLEPLPESANAMRLGTEDLSFDYSGLDYFRPFIGNMDSRPYGELLWDELRIGSTYSDVVGGIAVPLVPGDTNANGVGGEYPDDFDPIRANFRMSVAMRSEGDLVPNGIVDFADFQQWKGAFLGGGGSLAEVDLGFLANVPEPTAASLALIAASFALGARRRNRPF